MKKVTVFGTGCAKCTRLYDNAAQAIAKVGSGEYELEKVSDMNKFAAHGIMFTPAMSVDGEVKVSGRVPSAEEIIKMLA